MGEESKWCDYEGGDQTDEFLMKYTNEVREILLEKGTVGFKLGDPTICGYTAMQICVLDPQNDVPNEIILFAKDVSVLLNGEKPEVVGNDDLHYQYDKLEERYDMNFILLTDQKPNRSFRGIFDRNADILAMKEEKI